MAKCNQLTALPFKELSYVHTSGGRCRNDLMSATMFMRVRRQQTDRISRIVLPETPPAPASLYLLLITWPGRPPVCKSVAFRDVVRIGTRLEVSNRIRDANAPLNFRLIAVRSAVYIRTAV